MNRCDEYAKERQKIRTHPSLLHHKLHLEEDTTKKHQDETKNATEHHQPFPNECRAP
jgi:hypothetical protein